MYYSIIQSRRGIETRPCVGRPRTGRAKQLIAIRISPRLLAQLRRLAAQQDKPYQTLIHELLEQAAKRNVA